MDNVLLVSGSEKESKIITQLLKESIIRQFFVLKEEVVQGGL